MVHCLKVAIHLRRDRLDFYVYSRAEAAQYRTEGEIKDALLAEEWAERLLLLAKGS